MNIQMNRKMWVYGIAAIMLGSAAVIGIRTIGAKDAGSSGLPAEWMQVNERMEEALGTNVQHESQNVSRAEANSGGLKDKGQESGENNAEVAVRQNTGTDSVGTKMGESVGRSTGGEQDQSAIQSEQSKEEAASPLSERSPSPAQSSGTHTDQSGPNAAPMIDINRASSEQLQALPGIGASKSKAIVAYREQNGFFKKVEDIMKVKGIGPKMFAKMKEMITVDGGNR